MEILSSHRSFGGELGYYRHAAVSTDCLMRFSVFTPPQAKQGPVPLLWWLSGLTCTAENFTTKAGAYGEAARRGLMIVAPDTSPRGADVPDDAAYDLGQGAGFYVDATEPPWSKNFRMANYVAEELPALLLKNFPIREDAQGISGHSMGGHGALTLGLKYPDRYRSISAFAPIVAPMQCEWGEKAFVNYLGDDEAAWSEYDASKLMAGSDDRSSHAEILIDQGLNDEFLVDQLKPGLFELACKQAGQSLRLRLQEGYDHSYFFIASFIADHIQHHASILMD